jgi:hypothetical protein
MVGEAGFSDLWPVPACPAAGTRETAPSVGHKPIDWQAASQGVQQMPLPESSGGDSPGQAVGIDLC